MRRLLCLSALASGLVACSNGATNPPPNNNDAGFFNPNDSGQNQGNQDGSNNNQNDSGNNGGQDAQNQPPDSGMGGQDAQNPTDTGSGPTDSGVTIMSITVAQAVQSFSTYKGNTVQITNAVVTAVTGQGGPSVAGTFYIMDQGGTIGVAVYHSKTDSATFPAVGNLVTVQGRLSDFNGSIQISSSTTHGVMEQVTINSGSGTVMGGAVPPAGNPISPGNPSEYAHTNAGAHPEQIGNYLSFGGPLTASTDPGFIYTNADGGTRPEGFSVTNNIWVDDSNIYTACIKKLDGGLPNLSSGIKGVWDQYQDYYAGSAMNPAPHVPVLFPMTCSDIGM
jgi:hypothetical protein